MVAATLQSPLKPAGHSAALSVPNFRRFVLGRGVSLIGSWTETVAQTILVLQLTNSANSVGFVTAARYLPVLLLTLYAGLIVRSPQQKAHSHRNGILSCSFLDHPGYVLWTLLGPITR